ncbi:MAG: dihydroorotate dehydrogenase electron transfer subunit [Candidatus Heimdallarchaeota archaeon]|nr:dihydroorotate dehydrogenase electron transfer subunit [Candidatus Heimdallarchaeota archaeon]
MKEGKLGLLKVVPIKEIINETPADCRLPVKSYSLIIPEIVEKAIPGQFVMMWLPEVDEKPMGIASCDISEGKLLLAVAKLGKATTEFHKREKGELLGIRGPYGKGFTIEGENIGVIGGGTGIAPSRFLVERALERGMRVTLFHGAKTANELVFQQFFKQLAKKYDNFLYEPSTDDGSFGFHGFTTDCFEASLNRGTNFDKIYTCGPELMMYKILVKTHEKKLPLEACLADRYVKCAIGLCGQCTIDPIGLRLCIDGPVFNQDQLAKMEDFGKYSRDKFGKKIPF